MIGNRIALSVLLPSIVLIATAAFVARDLTVERRHALERAAETAAGTARVLGERINSSLIMAEFVASEVAQDLTSDPLWINAVVRLRQRQAYAPAVSRITIYTGSGQMFAASTGAAAGPRLSDCYAFDAKRPVQIHPERGGDCPLALSRVIVNNDGVIVWIVLAQVAGTFVASLNDLKREIGTESCITLLDEHQNIALAVPGDRTSDHNLAKSIGSGFFARGHQSVIDDQHLIGLYQLPSYALRVVVALERSAVLGAWWNRVQSTGLFGGLFIALTVAWGVLAARWSKRRQALETRLRNEERQRLRAEEANHMKSQFLHHMSHELRTPLNVILGFSEIIRDRVFGDAPKKYVEYASDIHASGTILLRIINDLLEIAKIESGKLDLRSDRVALDSVVHEAANLLREQFHNAGLDFRVDAPSCAVFGDSRAILQILLNVLSNAIKNTPEGGLVTIRIRHDDRIHVDIQDNGCGMDDATLARIGRPFEQGDNRLELAQKGTGLGLAVSIGLIKLMGGALDIVSAPGKGTTVTVSFNLPLPAVDSVFLPQMAPSTLQ